MKNILKHVRRGSTLIELLIFMVILSIVAIALIPILFSSAEDRLLQQTISIVEQNGTQLLQSMGYHIRHAEQVVSPSAGATGSVLTLQTASGATNPTIFGQSTGSLIMVRRTTKQTLSSSQVAVENFTVRHTAVSGRSRSVLVQFTISRTIRLQSPRRYSRTFEALFTLYPDDEFHTEGCTCALPRCNSADTYVWQVCDVATCLTAQTPLQCP